MIREFGTHELAQPVGRPEPLWIGIDGRNIKLREGTGVASYARGVAEAIALMGARAELVSDCLPGEWPDPTKSKPSLRSELAAALRPGSQEAKVTLPSQGRLVIGSHGGQYVERLRLLPDLFPNATTRFRVTGRMLTLRGATPPALMHWTYPLPVEFAGTPNVYTIHDLIPLSQSSLTGIPAGLHRRLIARIIRGGGQIATASECTRRELVELFGCAEDRVTTTYVPVDIAEHVPSTAEQIAPRLARLAGLVPGQYFLYVGAIEPRKNLPTLIRAHKASGVQIPLVLAGPDGWRADQAMGGNEITDYPGVIRLSYLDRKSLLDLIAHAKALLFPSLAEGFGIPLVEAMLLGTPALTSNRGALAEIAAGAALTLDPTDVKTMSEAISSLDTDEVLRQRLAWHGRARAADFSPEAHARRLERVYEAAIGSAVRGREPLRDSAFSLSPEPELAHAFGD